MAAVQHLCQHTAQAAELEERQRRYLLNSYPRQPTRSQSAQAARLEATARTACMAAPVAHLRSAHCVPLQVVLEASRLFVGLAALAATAVQVAAAAHMAQMRLVLAVLMAEKVAQGAVQMQERPELDKGQQRMTLEVQA